MEKPGRLVLKFFESDNSSEWISIGGKAKTLSPSAARKLAVDSLMSEPDSVILIVEVKAQLTANVTPRWKGCLGG